MSICDTVHSTEMERMRLINRQKDMTGNLISWLACFLWLYKGYSGSKSIFPLLKPSTDRREETTENGRKVEGQ